MEFSIKNFSFKMDFEKSAMRAIDAALRGGARVGVACSGGADSVFALLAVADIFRAHSGRIKVLHFNHRARKTAKRDEIFVRGLAESLGLEAFFGAPETAPKKKTEEVFRQMRCAFFADICKSKNIALIVQGHHANDAAETAIMRLCRGSGAEGLCAPAAVSELAGTVFARPLLNISKADIVAALKKAGAEWREDETNFTDEHFRNKIRGGVVPQITACAPNFLAGVRRSQTLLREDLDAVNAAFDSLFSPLNAEVGKCARLSDEIIGCRAFLRRAAMRLLAANGLLDGIRANALDAFLDAVADRALSGGSAPVKTSVGGAEMLFEPRLKTLSLSAVEKPESFRVEAGLGKCALPGGRTLSIKKITLGEERRKAILRGENDDSASAYLDISCFGDLKRDKLTIRSRRDGDAYAPIGAKSPKKLKELLNAKKTPILKRKSVFVVCNKKGEILWAPPAAPAEKFKITNSAVALELTLRE